MFSHRWKVFARSWLMPLLAAPTLPYGGQAAIEGVMMKGTNHAALAMRRRTGELEVLDREVPSRFGRLARTPFVRGFFILWDMMTLGMWAIRESSARFEADMEAAEREKKGEENVEAKLPENAGKPGILQTVMMIVSLAVALLVFKVLPAAAATGAFSLMGWQSLGEIANPTVWQQLLANSIEGIVKLSIFIAYIWSIGKIAEIARVFQYHGAEHIVINAYEADQEKVQDVSFVKGFTTAHPRCGTSFIVILILLSIVLFTLLDWALVAAGPAITAALPEWWLQAKWLGAAVQDNIPAWYLRWPLRILALPLLSGLSYEIIKAAFRFYGNPLLRPLLRFGMLFQALTTRFPTDDQIRVSLASFNRARYLTEGIEEPEISKERGLTLEAEGARLV
jgi:uncharacterized protein YqhQ